jgi:glucose-1-phosphate thymidylyltransferase
MENQHIETQATVTRIAQLPEELAARISQGSTGKKEIYKGVYAGTDVIVEPYVFFDTDKGDVIIGDGTKIKSHAILRGPLVLGENCVIHSFAEISSSLVGDVCKLGGEVEHCIIDRYSNKQHHGFLGHSYVGKWVNIGAGTSVSNLKNTYSAVVVQGIDTGNIFMGVILNDGVKTAINTSIFTGKVIGAHAHLYGIVTEDVPAFTSHVAPGRLYEVPLQVAKKIQKAMMLRRHRDWKQEDEEALCQLFAATREDRERAQVKKEKLSFI